MTKVRKNRITYNSRSQLSHIIAYYLWSFTCAHIKFFPMFLLTLPTLCWIIILIAKCFLDGYQE